MAKETFNNLPAQKRDRILQVAELEFAEYGFDLASIQRIVKEAKIPRGSFYQYFTDKTDIFCEILIRIKEQKFRYLAPAFEQREKLGFFGFLKLSAKLGFEYAHKEPLAVKIAEAIGSSKTLDFAVIINSIVPDQNDPEEFGSHAFYVMAVTQAVESGEINSALPPEKIALFAKLMLESIGKLIITHPSGITYGPEAEKLYDDFLSLLKYGLCSGGSDEK
jgi:AcrR family transcriptional regulator